MEPAPLYARRFADRKVGWRNQAHSCGNSRTDPRHQTSGNETLRKARGKHSAHSCASQDIKTSRAYGAEEHARQEEDHEGRRFLHAAVAYPDKNSIALLWRLARRVCGIPLEGERPVRANELTSCWIEAADGGGATTGSGRGCRRLQGRGWFPARVFGRRGRGGKPARSAAGGRCAGWGRRG